MEFVANSAPVRLFLSYLEHLGIDPRALNLRHVDRRIAKSREPAWVSARLIIELLETAAEFTGRDDIGVDFAAWVNPRSFGELSLAWEQCESLAERFAIDRRYLHLENNAVRVETCHEGNFVAIEHHVVPALRPRARQFLDGLVAVAVRTSRDALGQKWNPVRVEFAAPRVTSLLTYQRFFSCPLRFNASRHAVVIRRADFERPLSGGNPDMIAYLKKRLADREGAFAASLKDQVARLVASNLSGRSATLEKIATQLAMSPRTLQRQLADKGTSFRAVLESVRIQVATAYLEATPRPRLEKIAHDLGFSQSSAACRFLKSKVRLLYDETSGE